MPGGFTFAHISIKGIFTFSIIDFDNSLQHSSTLHERVNRGELAASDGERLQPREFREEQAELRNFVVQQRVRVELDLQ